MDVSQRNQKKMQKVKPIKQKKPKSVKGASNPGRLRLVILTTSWAGWFVDEQMQPLRQNPGMRITTSVLSGAKR